MCITQIVCSSCLEWVLGMDSLSNSGTKQHQQKGVTRPEVTKNTQ